uniref:DNA-directed DNA polymerase n=1 Tax=Heterorhabditis bacteriophora TaxID=37862 RepID=A0A1I7WPS1_HETBA
MEIEHIVKYFSCEIMNIKIQDQEASVDYKRYTNTCKRILQYDINCYRNYLSGLDGHNINKFFINSIRKEHEQSYTENNMEYILHHSRILDGRNKLSKKSNCTKYFKYFASKHCFNFGMKTTKTMYLKVTNSCGYVIVTRNISFTKKWKLSKIKLSEEKYVGEVGHVTYQKNDESIMPLKIPMEDILSYQELVHTTAINEKLSNIYQFIPRMFIQRDYYKYPKINIESLTREDNLEDVEGNSTPYIGIPMEHGGILKWSSKVIESSYTEEYEDTPVIQCTRLFEVSFTAYAIQKQ